MSVELLNLSAYEERSYEEKPSNKGYVEYGEDNAFPQYLVDLYKSSAVHHALCTSIAYMIYGKGVDCNNVDVKLKIAEWGLNEELRKACLDMKIQGGFALEVIYSIDRTTISKVRHLPFENLRSGYVNDKEQCDYYYYSRDWSDEKIEPQEVRAFEPRVRNEYPTQVLYVKPFSPGSYYYPKPDYIGSINYIELDKEIARYHINNIKNGLAPSFTIHFKNGVPSQEERNQLRNDIEQQLSGATNAGKFLLTFSDDPSRKPDFEPFPMSEADKQYEFLSREVTDKIMVGHRVVSPAMFGVKTEGQLGGTQEMATASALFDKQVVQPYQAIVEKAITSIVHACGLDGIVTIQNESVTEEVAEVTEMQAHDKEVATWLINCGEDEPEGYTMLDTREVNYDLEDKLDAMWTFATVIGAQGGDSEQDNDIVKVRYKYAPATVKDNSREFCKKMVAANKVYRKEDIIAAGSRAVNKGWGAGGADKYDVWKFKGGGSCRHFWQRVTYLQTNNEQISVNQAKALIASLPPEQRKENRIPDNEREVARRPRDMDNRGFIEPQNITTAR